MEKPFIEVADNADDENVGEKDVVFDVEDDEVKRSKSLPELGKLLFFFPLFFVLKSVYFTV